VITVVSGLPRSGTSLMMKMLHAGGMPVYMDDHQAVLLETHRAEQLRNGDTEWLADCEGKAVKILEPHKNPPPEGYEYRFIWMRRSWKEIARSQVKVLDELYPGPERSIHWGGIQELKRRTTEGQRILRKLGPVWVFHFEDILKDPTKQALRLWRMAPEAELSVLGMVSVVQNRTGACLPEIREKEWGGEWKETRVSS